MKTETTLKVQEDGVVVLPEEIRETYRLQPGDSLTLRDLGGILLLSPGPSEVGVLADRFSETLRDRGETLESMLEALRNERDRLAAQG